MCLAIFNSTQHIMRFYNRFYMLIGRIQHGFCNKIMIKLYLCYFDRTKLQLNLDYGVITGLHITDNKKRRVSKKLLQFCIGAWHVVISWKMSKFWSQPITINNPVLSMADDIWNQSIKTHDTTPSQAVIGWLTSASCNNLESANHSKRCTNVTCFVPA